MTETRDPWLAPGIEPAAEEPAIRTAFSVQLRSLGPNADSGDIEALVDARGQALNLAAALNKVRGEPNVQLGNWPRAHRLFLALFPAAIIGLLLLTKIAGKLKPVQFEDQLLHSPPAQQEPSN